MQQTPIDQSSLYTLLHSPQKQTLKYFRAPAAPCFGKHTVVRNRRVEVKAQKPQKIDPIPQLVHQLSFAGDIVVKEQEHELHYDFRIDRHVARAAVETPNGRNHKAQVQGGFDLPQRVLRIDPLLQINVIGK